MQISPINNYSAQSNQKTTKQNPNFGKLIIDKNVPKELIKPITEHKTIQNIADLFHGIGIDIRVSMGYIQHKWLNPNFLLKKVGESRIPRFDRVDDEYKYKNLILSGEKNNKTVIASIIDINDYRMAPKDAHLPYSEGHLLDTLKEFECCSAEDFAGENYTFFKRLKEEEEKKIELEQKIAELKKKHDLQLEEEISELKKKYYK